MKPTGRHTTIAIAAALLCACGAGGSGDDVDAAAQSDIDAGPVSPACDPYGARSAPPELFVGPDGLEDRLVQQIDGAQSELFVMMYLLTMDRFVAAFERAHNRGVDVRILLDPEHPGNVDSRNDLMAAGVSVRNAPSGFTHSHTKAMLIDGQVAVIMSSNMNWTSMSSERNYGVIDRDPDDIADLRAIFESDWTGEGYPDLSCTRLIVSPINTRQRILEHVNNAEDSLLLSVMYISDDSVRLALIARAEAGVAIRVLLADPQWIDTNPETASLLGAAGIAVRYLLDTELHAKLVVADGVPFIGSQNMSYTSFSRNREVGVMVTAATPAAAALSQFELDWARGVAP